MGQIKTRLIFYTTFLLFLPFTLSAFAQANRGMKLHRDRYALVIGNSAYQTVPLKNPINDAEDMSATLRKMGFKVILKKNADQRTMEDTIRYFGKQLRKGGVGLFYFAGHGMQVDGRNYLIPIEAKIESESDVKYEAVDAGRVLGKMEDAENQLNIVILDACRNNPYARNFRSTETGLARMDAPKGSLIAYATAPGEVAADGPERNGVFTKYLMEHMIEPHLPIERVLKRVRIDVARQTNGRQIPWESSSLMGDFYFNPTKAAETMETSKLSSPVEKRKKTLAAIPKTREKITRYKLAIFPWKIDLYYKRSINLFYDTYFDALENLLKSYNNILLKYSYYDHDKFGNDIEIIKDLFSEKGGIVWTKKSFFGTPSPNLDGILKIAAKINADLVMLYYTKSTGDDGQSFNSLYLVDTNEKVIIKKEYRAIEYSLNPFEQTMEELLSQYFRNKKKS
jgi:hypothetical protein